MLHASAYATLGLDWEYSAIDVDETQLASFLENLEPSWRGFSLTMPLKYELVRLADRCDALVEQTGVANTLLLEAVEGASKPVKAVFNTDVFGIVRAMDEAQLPAPRHVLILGGGATAASAIAAVADRGAIAVTIAVRNPARAASLVEMGHRVGSMVEIIDLAKLAEPLRTDLVVSTLPGGAELDVEISSNVRSRAPLFDVAYHPWPSSLAQQWLDVGGSAIPGHGMLLHQALMQIRIFLRGDPFAELPREGQVLAAMRQSLTAAL